MSTEADYHEACRRLGYDPDRYGGLTRSQRVAVWDAISELRRERGAGPILTSDGRTGPGCTASDAAENLPVEDDEARP